MIKFLQPMTIAGKPYSCTPQALRQFGIRTTFRSSDRGAFGINVSGVAGISTPGVVGCQLLPTANFTGAGEDNRGTAPLGLKQLFDDGRSWLALRDGAPAHGASIQRIPGGVLPLSQHTPTHHLLHDHPWGVALISGKFTGGSIGHKAEQASQHGVLIFHNGDDTSVAITPDYLNPIAGPNTWHAQVTYNTWHAQVTHQSRLYSIDALQSFHGYGHDSTLQATARIAMTAGTQRLLYNMFAANGYESAPVPEARNVTEAADAWEQFLGGPTSAASGQSYSTWALDSHLFVRSRSSFDASGESQAGHRTQPANEALGMHLARKAALFFEAAFQVRNAQLG